MSCYSPRPFTGAAPTSLLLTVWIADIIINMCITIMIRIFNMIIIIVISSSSCCCCIIVVVVIIRIVIISYMCMCIYIYIYVYIYICAV